MVAEVSQGISESAWSTEVLNKKYIRTPVVSTGVTGVQKKYDFERRLFDSGKSVEEVGRIVRAYGMAHWKGYRTDQKSEFLITVKTFRFQNHYRAASWMDPARSSTSRMNRSTLNMYL